MPAGTGSDVATALLAVTSACMAGNSDRSVARPITHAGIAIFDVAGTSMLASSSADSRLRLFMDTMEFRDGGAAFNTALRVLAEFSAGVVNLSVIDIDTSNIVEMDKSCVTVMWRATVKPGVNPAMLVAETNATLKHGSIIWLPIADVTARLDADAVNDWL